MRSSTPADKPQASLPTEEAVLFCLFGPCATDYAAAPDWSVAASDWIPQVEAA